MSQPNKYVPQTSFAADVRSNKPGRGMVNAGAVDDEFRAIRVSVNKLCDNLALIQRDDGKLKDAAVDVHTLHKDVLMLLGNYELFGQWQPNMPYLQGYVVEHEGKLYVCAESHDANDAMDLSKFKAFGAAGGATLTGDYLPVTWDETFFSADADTLVGAGVYVLKEGDAVSYLLVLGSGDDIGQLRIGADGLSLRFKTATGWGDWEGTSEKVLPATLDENSDNTVSDGTHTHKLSRASDTVMGIVKLGHDYESGSEDVAASLKALLDGMGNVKAFASSEITRAIGTLVGGSGGSVEEPVYISDVPVGSLMYFDLEEAPQDYLVADGSEQRQSDYPELYAAIGNRYGNAAIGFFRLPDGRAEFLRGLDKGRGVDGGRVLGSNQGSTAGRHYHGIGVMEETARRVDNEVTNTATYFYMAARQWDDGTETAPAPPNNRWDRGWFIQYGNRPTVVLTEVTNTSNPPPVTPPSRKMVYTAKYAPFGGGFGAVSSLDIAASGRQGESRPRNLAMLLCIKAKTNKPLKADEQRAGMAKLYQGTSNNAFDGALSVRAAVELATESKKWENLTGKPSSFPPATHTHAWTDITGAPELVLKSVYEAKIQALEARLDALETP